ncbi:MAG: lipoyl(octanoyl) transferase LipB [Alphaproteobacteria bacterium]|nr:lipoyl(octanoyl) transferase LipB [Alphaproteobacteria bacterium]
MTLRSNVEWKISNTLINYDFAISEMQKRIIKIKNNSDNELIWLLEHSSIFTAGTSAKDEDLINNQVETRRTGRGGEWTWHGPGQRVVYVMLNLKKRLPDVKAYVNALEEWIILTLEDFDIHGVRLENKPGVWVINKDNRYDKIAALGVRISSWVSWHGISINVNPNLEQFKNIVPCGIQDGGVTSLYNLENISSFEHLDNNLSKNFTKVFGNQSLFKLN